MRPSRNDRLRREYERLLWDAERRTVALEVKRQRVLNDIAAVRRAYRSLLTGAPTSRMGGRR